MQLHHLKYILKVAELGSITKAANKLYISQPTLTKAILNLEKEYNIKIFERMPTGVIVTPEGRYFLNFVENIVNSATSLDEVFKNSFSINQTQLLVAAQQLDFIPEIFVNLHNAYRHTPLKFDLYTSHRSDVIKAVQKGSYNIGLLVQTTKDTRAFNWQIDSTNLEIGFLDSCNVYALLGPKSRLYETKSLSFKDVEKLPHICLDIDQVTWSNWKVNNKHLYINTDDVIFCNSLPLCIELLQKTDMILYASKWILKYFLDTNIKVFPIKNSDMYKSNLIYIKRKNEALTPIEIQFIEEVKINCKSLHDIY